MVASIRDPRTARLDEAFSRGERFSGQPEIQADYARYLCVLVTGHLEKEIVRIFQEYVDSQADHRTSSYFASTMRSGSNMRADRISNIAKSFDPSWKESLKQPLTTQLRDTIGSAYTSRNSIAHGDDVDLTFLRVKEYYEQVKQAIHVVESIVVQR